MVDAGEPGSVRIVPDRAFFAALCRRMADAAGLSTRSQGDCHMKIDRAGFLVLAGAIAAGGCVIKSTTTKHDNDGGSGGTGGTTAQGGQGGTTAQGGQGGVGGSVCDDSVGTDVDCSPAAQTMCGQFAVDACEAAKAAFKPRVAENAAGCIVALPADADCLPVYDCRRDALNGACSDSTADADCDQLVAACGDVTTEECHSLVDGLNEQGRAEMVTCAVTDGCVYGFYSCVEGLGFVY